ncbi:MAG: helix-turn-helix domain-containing protein [Firmicutes bacterium]|nr:helix-turn-helix domain-containing protein [Bacillota bacterium]
MSFKIIRCDIEKTKADAIVNIIYIDTSEVDFAPGYTSITPVSGIASKYIINTYIPKNSGKQLIRQVYDKSLRLAGDNNCTSIAFPFIPEETDDTRFSSETAVNAFTDFLKIYDIEIFLALSETENINLSEQMEKDINKLIYDTFPIAPVSTKEYFPRHERNSFKGFFGGIAAGFSLSKSADMPCTQKNENRSAFESVPKFLSVGQRADETAEEAACEDERISSIDSLDSALKKIYTDSFEKHLQKLINKKGLKNSEVYAAANISKQYFSKLLKGKVKPSKEKILALAVGLQLNLDETIDFLSIAGYALSPISQTDIIVKYFINHKDYNVIKIDIVLFDYGLEPLSG